MIFRAISWQWRAGLAVGLLLLWSLSVAAAYRYGRDQAELAALREMERNIARQLAEHQATTRQLDQLAQRYAHEQAHRVAQIRAMENQINDYLSTVSNQCVLDDRGVQLINQLITPAAVARGAEQPHPLPPFAPAQ